MCFTLIVNETETDKIGTEINGNMCWCLSVWLWAGADPGFLVGGGANIQICQIFPKTT